MSEFKKKCTQCGKSKLASADKIKTEFAKNPHTNDGFFGICRICHGENISKGRRGSSKVRRGKAKRRKINPTKMYDLKDVLWTSRGEVVYHQGVEIAIASDEKWAEVIASTRNELIRSRAAVQIFEQLKQVVGKDLLKENEKLREEMQRLRDLTLEKKPIPKVDGNGGAHKRKLRLEKRYPINKEVLMGLIKERESSVTQIAKVINKTDVCLYNYMNGKSDCKMADIQELADYFEIDTAHLVDKQKYRNKKK